MQGVPLPSQERNAIDVVVQYAINELDFNIEDIVMYGWSIGGYTATWAAVNYPDLRGLVRTLSAHYCLTSGNASLIMALRQYIVHLGHV